MSSPCEALRAESTVNGMGYVICQNIANSREKTIRLPEDDLRRVSFERVCRSSLKRINASSETENFCKRSEHHRATVSPQLDIAKKKWEFLFENFWVESQDSRAFSASS